jgi:Family of unknown function (DUF5837)
LGGQSFFLRKKGLSDPPEAVERVPSFKELIMKGKTRLSPQQSAPVDRVIVSDQADLLGELSEESLSAVAPSGSIECIRVCACASLGSDE